MRVGEVDGGSGVGGREVAAPLGKGSQCFVQGMNVRDAVRHGRHCIGNSRFDASFYEGQALPGRSPLRDGMVKDVVSFGLNDSHGCSQLGGPVKGEADVHSQIFVSRITGEVGGKTCPNWDGVVQLLVESSMVTRVSGVTAMENTSNHALARVDRDTCPVAEEVHLSALDMQVGKVTSESTGVISISEATCVVLILEIWRETLLPISSASSFKPPMERLNINDEEKG